MPETEKTDLCAEHRWPVSIDAAARTCHARCMRILILGGTAWLGRTVAEVAVQAGHQVTCLARGTGVPEGVTLVQADRDLNDALSALARVDGAEAEGGEPSGAGAWWDAVIDVSMQPGHVRRAVRDLEPVAARYVLVSTCSVYADQGEPGADEDAPLLEPLAGDRMEAMEQYGHAKVACEQAVLMGFGRERSAIVRPGLIGGPGDPSGRTGYWPHRFARPSNPDGRVLVPDAPDLPTAVIDVRDLAQFLVHVAVDAGHGVFNALGEPVPFPEHLEVARRVAGHTGPVVRAAQDWLLEQDVAEWAGPRSLPLWLADRDWYGMNTRSIDRARAAGLTLRPLADTLADSLAWDLEHQVEIFHGAGLTDQEERDLLGTLGQSRR